MANNDKRGRNEVITDPTLHYNLASIYLSLKNFFNVILNGYF
jgi:hypothetical protein